MTKARLQSDLVASTSRSIKEPCVAASTANLTLSGEQTVDGIALTEAARHRCFAKDQSTGAENGIYIVQIGTWLRAEDWNDADDVGEGTMVPVSRGTTNANTMWAVSNTGSVTIGTTATTFVQVLGNTLTSSIIDVSGTPVENQVVVWVDENTVNGSTKLVVNAAGNLAITGDPTGTGGLDINDTSPIYLGSSNQGRLQYSTDHLLLQQDTGTDPLTIVNTQQGKLGRLQARNGANTATKTCLTWGGTNPGVTLTHDGTDVLDTSSTGVTVNGALEVDDISVTDNANSGTEILVNNSDSGTSAYAGFAAVAESARVDIDAFSTTYTPVTAWQDAGVVSTTGAASGGLHLNAQAGGVTMSYTSTPVVKIDSTGLGFFNTTPVAQPDITGSAAGNAALQNLLTALANLGLITDSST